MRIENAQRCNTKIKIELFVQMCTDIIFRTMRITRTNTNQAVARYPARQRGKPERFSDVLTVVKSKKCVTPSDKLSGYVSDGGFVLGDNEGLECDSEDEDEEEMEFDDDSEEEEELELDD